jgi:hypothetical protein
MSEGVYILSPSSRPDWLEYPHAFRRIVEQMLVDVTPWHILEGERALSQFRGLAERYPDRELFPFAYRQDNDDVACWSKGTGEKVFVIHDFASPGWEDEGAFDDVWSWFRSAIEEMILWD